MHHVRAGEGNSHPSLNSWAKGEHQLRIRGVPTGPCQVRRAVLTHSGRACLSTGKTGNSCYSSHLLPMRPILPTSQAEEGGGRKQTFSRCLYFAGETNAVQLDLLM